MASIKQVKGKWRAQIRRKGHAAQCKTFPTKGQATHWAKEREREIDDVEAGTGGPVLGPLTVQEVITAYRRLRDASRPIVDSSTEFYTLKKLEAGLGEFRVDRLTPEHLVAFARQRSLEDKAGPYTINMDVSKLGTVFKFGGMALRRALPDVVGAARPMLTYLRLIGDGGKRERRPTEDELRRVLVQLQTARGLAYADAVAFAACSAMRRGEVCAMKLSDIDPVTKTVPVERKHPRKGKVLEVVPLMGEAWEIAERQPASDDGRVFPLHPGTLSKYFTEACRALSIPDLHLHDMRHEGTSRLFEQGYSVPEVALVTGHKDWKHLKRYTNLRPEDLTKTRVSPTTPAPHLPARSDPELTKA